MDNELKLFPEQASVSAARLDHLYFFLVGTALFFTVLIFLLIVYFALRYRRGVQVNRANAPTFNLKLELAWSIVPLIIMMASFFWGARLFIDSFYPPQDAIDIFVVGKQWMWKIQHGEGRTEINQLHVPAGKPVRLRMISEDVIHSFYVPAFRTKQDVLPGRYTTMWFEASQVGTYHLFCAEYCGTSHSQMRGHVIVMPPAEYARWMTGAVVEAPEVVGKRLFERYRCGGCHEARTATSGPPLHDFFETPAQLQDGESVKRGLSYFRESLYAPNAKVVAGYKPVMPSYKPGKAPPGSELTEEQLLQVAAYIKTLAPSRADDARQ